MNNPTFQTAEEKNFYKCPACGGLVNNREREEVRFHHDHVLHPPVNRYVRLPIAPPPRMAA